MPVNPNLSAIAAKIRALQAKTTASGASEAEALAAALKARELLDKYQLDMTEFEIKEEGTSQQAAPSDRQGIASRLANAIASFCSCKVWTSDNRAKIQYLGLRSDSEFASWLTTSLSGFCQSAALDYSLFSSDGADPALVASFLNGTIQRINTRLKGNLPATGTSLVVLKNALVEEAYAKLNLRLGQGRAVSYTSSRADAFAAGQAAGDLASFGKPLSPGGSQLAIGRG